MAIPKFLRQCCQKIDFKRNVKKFSNVLNVNQQKKKIQAVDGVNATKSFIYVLLVEKGLMIDRIKDSTFESVKQVQ